MCGGWINHIEPHCWEPLKGRLCFPLDTKFPQFERDKCIHKNSICFFCTMMMSSSESSCCVIGAFGGSGNDPGIPSSLGISSSSSPSLSYWRVKSAFVCVSMGLLAWVCAGLSFRAFFSKKTFEGPFLCRVRTKDQEWGSVQGFRVPVGFLGQSSVTKTFSSKFWK